MQPSRKEYICRSERITRKIRKAVCCVHVDTWSCTLEAVGPDFPGDAECGQARAGRKEYIFRIERKMGKARKFVCSVRVDTWSWTRGYAGKPSGQIFQEMRDANK